MSCLLCYTRERVKREEKEILQHQTASLYKHFVGHPRSIPHAPMYHPNIQLWSYTSPPPRLISTQPCHIVPHCNTSNHFLIVTNYTATPSQHPHAIALVSQRLRRSVTLIPSIRLIPLLSTHQSITCNLSRDSWFLNIDSRATRNIKVRPVRHCMHWCELVYRVRLTRLTITNPISERCKAFRFCQPYCAPHNQLPLRWHLLSGGGSGMVTGISAHKCGLYIEFGCMSMHSAWILKVAWPKIIHSPLMLRWCSIVAQVSDRVAMLSQEFWSRKAASCSIMGQCRRTALALSNMQSKNRWRTIYAHI